MNYSSANQFINSDAFVYLVFAGIMASYVLIMVIYVLIALLMHLLMAFPLYRMAKNAGYDKPWLAFIPFMAYYVAFVLPIKEFSLIGLYKTTERRNGFFIYISLFYIVPIVGYICGVFLNFIPLLGSVLNLVLSLLIGIGMIFASITKAIMMIDLFDLYWGKEKEALSITLGILSVFIPLIFPIVCIILNEKEPEYGFGNYYNPIVAVDYDEEY